MRVRDFCTKLSATLHGDTMRKLLPCVLRVVAFLILPTLLGAMASGQSFSFPVGGFTAANVCANSGTPSSACQVLTNGSPSRPQVANGGVLRLTTANQNQHGSAWFSI